MLFLFSTLGSSGLRKMKRLHKTLLLVVFVVGALPFCSVALAWERGELLIWTPESFGNEGLRQIEEKFKEDTGASVTVYATESDKPTRVYNQQVVLSRGPDIFLRAHDRIGSMAQAGLIADIKPQKKTLANLERAFWSAVSYNGKYYGYPISVEGPTQICNADMVSTPFKTFDEVSRENKKWKRQNKWGLMFNYTDVYFAYGIFSAEGGFAFEYKNGAYNPASTGVNNRGTVAGLKAIKNLYVNGDLPKEIDYGIFDTAFKERRAACIINGPWSWSSYKNEGIKLVIGNYPRVGSGTPRVFTGVLTAVLNPSSPNLELAQKFMEEYVLTKEGLRLINNDKPLGAVTHIEFMKELAKKDKVLADAYSVWREGEPMPNIPKMTRFWTHMGNAISKILRDNEDVKTELDKTAERITR